MVGLQIRSLEYWAVIIMNVSIVFIVEMGMTNWKILNDKV